MKFIKGTAQNGLELVPCKSLEIIGYKVVRWASSVERKSVSGYCYKMCYESSLVSWKSKKQPIVTLSRCESEYIAMTFAIQEGTFQQQPETCIYSRVLTRSNCMLITLSLVRIQCSIRDPNILTYVIIISGHRYLMVHLFSVIHLQKKMLRMFLQKPSTSVSIQRFKLTK